MLVAVLLLLPAVVSSLTISKPATGTGCWFDGYYSNASASCRCQSPYLGSTDCHHFACMNEGIRSLDGHSCRCPPGFLGAHCEPVQCTATEDLKRLSSSQSLTIIWTDNSRMRNLTNDNVTNSLRELVGTLKDSGITQLQLTFLGTDSNFETSCLEPNKFATCFNENLDLVDMFTACTSGCKDLTTDVINRALTNSLDNSHVLIVTNVGIADSEANNGSAMSKLLHRAVIRRIKVSTFVGAPMSDSRSVYIEPEFMALKKLAYHTMGIFANPYFPGTGGTYHGNADSLNKAIADVEKRLLKTTVIHSGRTDGTLASFDFLVNPEAETIFTVRTSDTLVRSEPPNCTLTITPSVPFINVSFGHLYVFTVPPTRDVNRLAGNITVNFCNLTFEVSQAAPSGGPSYRTFIAFSQATSPYALDASSPVPLSGIENLILGATPATSYSDFSKKLEIIDKTGNETFTPLSVTERAGCQFDRYFGRIICSHDDYGRFKVSAPSLNYSEVIPYRCTGSIEDYVEPASAAFYRLASSNSADCVVQAPTRIQNIADGTIGRSLGIALLNHVSITKPLLIAPDDRNLIVAVAKLIEKKPANYFRNYVTNLFWNGSSNPVISKSFVDFKNGILINVDWDNNGTSSCAGSLPGVEEALIDMLTISGVEYFMPRSEIYVITDMGYGDHSLLSTRLYRSVLDSKVKVNFLLYVEGHCDADLDDSMDVYRDIAMRSGGIAVQFFSLTDIVEFISSGIFGAPIVLQRDHLESWNTTQHETRNFSLVSGHSYAFLSEMGSADTHTYLVNSIGGRVTELLGTFTVKNFYVYFINDTINFSSGKYFLRIQNMARNAVLQYRLVDLTSTAFYALVFTDEMSTDAITTLVTFGQEVPSYPVLALDWDSTSDSSVSMYYVLNSTTDFEFHSSSIQPRGPSCLFPATTGYEWYCDKKEGVYYFEVNFNYGNESVTRTEAITCLFDGTNCLHGGTDLHDGNCSCPLGWTGEGCSRRICFNGGTLEKSGLCTCDDGYEGDFCENMQNPCLDKPQFPKYRKEVGSLFILLHSTKTAFDVASRHLNSSKWGYAQQYVLITFGTKVAVHISTTDLIHFKDMINEVLTKGPPENLTEAVSLMPALKAAMNTQVTLKSLVVVVVEETLLDNSTSSMIDAELSLSMSANYAEMRILSAVPNFASASMPGDSLQYMAAIGNSIAITLAANDPNDQDYQYYINLHLGDPANLGGIDGKLNRPSTTDYVYYKSCPTSTFVVQNILESGVAKNTDSLWITVLNGDGAPDRLNKSRTFPNAIIYFTTNMTLSSFTLNFAVNSSCGYLVEKIGMQHLAYGYSSLTFNDEGVSAASLGSGSNLVFHIPNVVQKSVFTSFPHVTMSEIADNGEVLPRFEAVAPISRDQCTYRFVTPFNCTTPFFTARIFGTEDRLYASAYNFQRAFTVFCVNLTTLCKHGTYDSVMGCSCDDDHEGSDCSLPKCRNGGTRDGIACFCPEGCYGDLCENTVLSGGSTVPASTTTIQPLTTNSNPAIKRVDFDFFIINQCAPYKRVQQMTNWIVDKFMNAANFSDSEKRFFYLYDNGTRGVSEWTHYQHVNDTLRALTTSGCTPDWDAVFRSLKAVTDDVNYTRSYGYRRVFYVTQRGSTLRNPADWQMLQNKFGFRFMAVAFTKLFVFDQAEQNALRRYFSPYVFTNFYEDAVNALFAFDGKNTTETPPSDVGHSNPCTWNLQADIYLYIDVANTGKEKYLDVMKNFTRDFGSGLDIGADQGQTQIMTGSVAATSIQPMPPIVSCRQVLVDLGKVINKDKNDVDYAKVLSTIQKYWKNPKFGSRQNMSSPSVNATSTNLIFFTTKQFSANQTAFNISLKDFLQEGITIYVVYFNDNATFNESSDIVKMTSEDTRFLVDTASGNSGKSVVTSLWQTLCSANQIIATEPISPDIDNIGKYDLVVIRDYTIDVSNTTNDQINTQIVKMIDQMNSDYQKFAYVTVANVTTVWAKDDDACKQKSLDSTNTAARANRTATVVDYSNVVQYLVTSTTWNNGVHLHDNTDLRIIFITTTNNTTGGDDFENGMRWLKSNAKNVNVGVLPINQQLPREIDDQADCVFYGKTIEEQFSVAISWIKGEQLYVRCKETLA